MLPSGSLTWMMCNFPSRTISIIYIIYVVEVFWWRKLNISILSRLTRDKIPVTPVALKRLQIVLLVSVFDLRRMRPIWRITVVMGVWPVTSGAAHPGPKSLTHIHTHMCQTVTAKKNNGLRYNYHHLETFKKSGEHRIL